MRNRSMHTRAGRVRCCPVRVCTQRLRSQSFRDFTRFDCFFSRLLFQRLSTWNLRSITLHNEAKPGSFSASLQDFSSRLHTRTSILVSSITRTMKQMNLQNPWRHMVILIKIVTKFVPHYNNFLRGGKFSYDHLTKSPL